MGADRRKAGHGRGRNPGPKGREASRGGSGTGGRADAGEPLSWWRVVSIAVLFAVPAGFLEVALVRYILSLGLPLRVSREYFWMAPTAYVLGLGLVAAVLIGVGRFWRRAVSVPVVVGVLSAVALWSVLLAVEWVYPLATLVVTIGVGWQLSRLARGGLGRVVPDLAPGGAVGLLVLVAVLAALSLSGAGRREARISGSLPAAESGTSVLLIILDTVRARSMGLYDRTRGNTPNLEALAAEGVVFDRAYAASPWTLPSHATMFTGVWPVEHGATWKRPLDARRRTLAEALRDRGYRTAGFVGNLTYANHNFGLDRGFSRFEDYPVNLVQIVFSSSIGRRLASMDGLRAALGLHDELNRIPASVVTDRFLEWQEGLDAERPFFAFLNYFDAHEPLEVLVEPEPVAPLVHQNALVTGESAHFRIPRGQQARFLEIYRQGYEATIGALDREVGRLLVELDRRGALDRTLVVVASDHGELIGEFNLFGHDSSLYSPTLRVPLVLRLPGTVPAGVRVPAPVSLRNLSATVLDLTGGGAGGLPGRSLAARWNGAAGTGGTGAAPGDTVYAYLQRGMSSRLPPWAPVLRGRAMETVIDRSLQYILNGDGSEELYDVALDPWRRPNLADGAAAPGELDRLRTLLERACPDAVAEDPPRSRNVSVLSFAGEGALWCTTRPPG